jgi:hypothetical protein
MGNFCRPAHRQSTIADGNAGSDVIRGIPVERMNVRRGDVMARQLKSGKTASTAKAQRLKPSKPKASMTLQAMIDLFQKHVEA